MLCGAYSRNDETVYDMSVMVEKWNYQEAKYGSQPKPQHIRGTKTTERLYTMSNTENSDFQLILETVKGNLNTIAYIRTETEYTINGHVRVSVRHRRRCGRF